MSETKAPGLTKPLVHLNGTSRSALEAGYMTASNAVADALAALAETAPNGRDYYPLGGDAILRAMKEHRARVDRLVDVRRELLDLVEAVQEAV